MTRPDAVFGDLLGSIVLSPRGESRFLDSSGAEDTYELEDLLKPLRDDPAFGLFIRDPETGLRVGEALESMVLLEPLLRHGDIDGAGELVLTAIAQADDGEIAEFAINSVGQINRKLPGIGQRRSKARLMGILRVSTATGLLTGESTYQLERENAVTRATGSVGTDIKGNGTISVTMLPRSEAGSSGR